MAELPWLPESSELSFPSLCTPSSSPLPLGAQVEACIPLGYLTGICCFSLYAGESITGLIHGNTDQSERSRLCSRNKPPPKFSLLITRKDDASLMLCMQRVGGSLLPVLAQEAQPVEAPSCLMTITTVGQRERGKIPRTLESFLLKETKVGSTSVSLTVKYNPPRHL